MAWVPLEGEFDLSRLEELKGALDTAGTPEGMVVDLSEVTFLDLESVRELAFRCRLAPGGVQLVNPSWQVAASVSASGLREWVRFGESEPAVFSGVS